MEGERRGIAWAAAAILIWATLAAAVSDALDRVPFATLVATALLFSAPTLWVVEMARGRSVRAVVTAPWRVVVLGLWGILVYHELLFAALEKAPPVEANLLNYLWPLFIVLLAPLVLKERVTALQLIGAFVGFAGAALVVTQGKAPSLSREHLVGYGLALTAAVAWSSFSVLLKKSGGGERMTLFVSVSVVPAVAFALVRDGWAPPTGRALFAAAWLGIGPMGLAFWAWSRGLELASASRIGLLSYAAPLLSTLALAVVLGKPVSGASAVGMVLIVVGSSGPAVLGRS